MAQYASALKSKFVELTRRADDNLCDAELLEKEGRGGRWTSDAAANLGHRDGPAKGPHSRAASGVLLLPDRKDLAFDRMIPNASEENDAG